MVFLIYLNETQESPSWVDVQLLLDFDAQIVPLETVARLCLTYRHHSQAAGLTYQEIDRQLYCVLRERILGHVLAAGPCMYVPAGRSHDNSPLGMAEPALPPLLFRQPVQRGLYELS